MNDRVRKKINIFFVIVLLCGVILPSTQVAADNTGYEPENPGIKDEQTDEGNLGMVVTAHPLASEVGSEVLKKGGNAVDAAVATQLALNVVEPMMSGIGGGGFLMHYDAASEDISIINSRERAPQGASPDMFIDRSNIVTDPGKFMLGAIDLNGDSGGAKFHVDDIQVFDLQSSQTIFEEDFEGGEGSWDADKFNIYERGTTFSESSGLGKILFGPPYGNNSSSFGQTTAIMDEIEDSELSLRFRTDDPGEDRRLRLWLRADEYRSTGTTYVKNGYGIEINSNTNEVRVLQSKDSTTSTLGSFSISGTTDWQNLRFQVEGNQLRVKHWEDDASEPNNWNIETFAGEVIPFSERVQSGLSVGVPGTLKGLEDALEQRGTMELDELIEPAIDLAADGFPVNWALADAIESNQDKLSKTAAKDVFLPNGTPLEEGDLLVQEDLAKSFRLIQEQGTEVFYNGEIGEALAEEVGDRGSSMELSDLSNYQTTAESPVWGDYMGYDIASMPPPSSGGITMLQLLEMFEQLDLTQFDIRSMEKYHYMTESMHLAYADRGAYMGDPEFFDVPLEGLLHPDYVAERIELISPDRANDHVEPGNPYEYQGGEPSSFIDQPDDKVDGQTTHFTIADRWGNLVSYTTTIEQVFGSGIMVPEYGIMLNNELTDFDAIPGGANEVQPNKRPLSSMTPTIVLDEGRPYMTVGSPGGATIITSVTQTIVNTIGYEMSIKDAIEEPRIYSNTYPSIRWEYGIGESIRERMEQLGHRFETSPREIGNVNSIVLDQESGMYFGAADSTREGTAIGLSFDDFPGIIELIELVEMNVENGEISSDAGQTLLTHLSAVQHFKETNQMNKAIKHLENMEVLVNHFYDNGKISEDVYHRLLRETYLILDLWEIDA
ncbi:gamma-glutamyltransferase [Oceanobacillus sp. E9]|uniref:gamma-glutamyltransferase n=1 Tax=Oceanobacillus sp. E9 TaxID=1742575 RepID=UPI00084E62CA|nr:gamma-glutamyltransferase [Oceanobacillus sp. E9]OEH54432.1 gamma-glutamyltransferase [Oceanobacillus sp. E9]